MIIWDLNPVAFSVGSLDIRWYGLVYATGFLLAYWLLHKAVREQTVPHLTERHVENYVLLLMIVSIACARILHVLSELAFYATQPGEVVAVWHGGLSFFGGILGAAAVTWWYTRKHRLSFYKIADLLALPLALVLVFGRLANYANAELWGTVTTVPWCVQFPNVDGCRHPSQLYEALYSYVIFVVLLIMQEVRKWRDGALFWSFLLLYGAFRFVENFFREPDQAELIIGSLSVWQWLCAATVLLAVFWLVTHRPVTNKA